MFLNNKYSKWYLNIVANAKNRVFDKSEYTEKHHIIPKCFGGSNESGNLVTLTAREHFVCHLLLTKMVKGKDKSKMCFALNMMLVKRTSINRYIPSSQLYAYSRKKNSEAQRSKTVSESAKIAIGNAHRGKIVSAETKLKQSLARKNMPGRIQSAEEREKRVKSRAGYTHSVATRTKIGLHHKGKTISAETRNKMTKTRKSNFESSKILVLVSPSGETFTQDKKQTCGDFCLSHGLKYQTVKISLDTGRKMRSGWSVSVN